MKHAHKNSLVDNKIIFAKLFVIFKTLKKDFDFNKSFRTKQQKWAWASRTAVPSSLTLPFFGFNWRHDRAIARHNYA